MQWNYLKRKKHMIVMVCFSMCFVILFNVAAMMSEMSREVSGSVLSWVDFKVTAEAMNDALEYDIASHDEQNHIDWIDLLAYLGAKYGGDFKQYKRKHIEEIAERLKAGESIDDITENMKYFGYYSNAYQAVLGGMVGDYYLQTEESLNVTPKFDRKYGLKAYSPIAYGYTFSHSDDFGNSRSYGYKRRHLGHDLMGNVGTPIINVETCVVEVVGWNQYGGWRIGMRSLDGHRYYYYAHLRKGLPYASGLEEGQTVYAGEVIGYMGMTGYSVNEDYNGMSVPHLHFGMQIIFDESQKDTNEIWIDTYEIVKFLEHHKSSVVRNGDREFVRKYLYYDGIE